MANEYKFTCSLINTETGEVRGPWKKKDRPTEEFLNRFRWTEVFTPENWRWEIKPV